MQQLREMLQHLTHVPADKQKIMGLKPAASNGATVVTEAGVIAGKTMMLVGSAEGAAIPSAQAAKTEDPTAGHSEVSATSNGLKNIANTCYMNAAIQLIRTIPEIKECLCHYTGPNNFLKQFGALLASMDATKDPVTPFLFWASLVELNPTFGERDDHGHFMQQDAQEVLSAMFQQVSTILPPKYHNLLAGSLQQILTCTEDPEDKGKQMEVPFTLLTCNIGGEVQTLEAGLEQALNETFVATCEALQREAAYTKAGRISKLPEYLVVHLVRFSWKNDIQKKAKILKPITFPMTLDLLCLITEDLRREQRPYREEILKRRDKEVAMRKRGRGEVPPPEEQEVKEEVVPLTLHNESAYFELCGVISHKGRSADSGHYVYWGKKASQWLIYDDENVATVSEEDVKRLRGVGEAHIAYVLLFRSRDPLSHRPVLPL